MTDSKYNTFKNKYSNKWGVSTQRENVVKTIIENYTGLKVNFKGLGAGSTEFYAGTAEENGKEKSAPDLQIEGTNIFIEVTGSFSKKTNDGDDIWIRPDKLNYAYQHINEHDEYLAVQFAKTGTWYVMHVTPAFLQYGIQAHRNKTDFNDVFPHFDGSTERYISIKYNPSYIKGLPELVQNIDATVQKKMTA